MLRLRNGSMSLLIIAGSRVLIVQVESVLLHGLMRWLHHNGLDLMGITNIRHLLSIQRLLLAKLA